MCLQSALGEGVPVPDVVNMACGLGHAHSEEEGERGRCKGSLQEHWRVLTRSSSVRAHHSAVPVSSWNSRTLCCGQTAVSLSPYQDEQQVYPPVDLHMTEKQKQ